MTDIPEKLERQSLDIAADCIKQLREDFPQVFRDGRIDFDTLKRALGEWIEPENERFGLQWPGKAAAFRAVQTPSVATLLPDPEKSVDWDTTQNLIIEGDNLEVLKLLQKSYYGKVKMIYIDPPYNTGNDFIYPDNYREGLQSYLEFTGQVNAEGKRLITEPERVGRYHSNWLNMMYPRLYLARNLLRDDGVIFVSIDDHEVANLRLVMNEVFGEENFLAEIVRATGTTTGQDASSFGSSYDIALVYARSSDFILGGIPLSDKDEARFSKEDARGRYSLLQLRKTGNADRRADRPSMYYPIEAPDGSQVFPIGPGGYESRWRFGPETYRENVKNDMIEWQSVRRGVDEVWQPYVKFYLEGRSKRPSNLWSDLDGNKKATLEVKELVGESVFDNPKPTAFIKRQLEISTEAANSEVVLDFFAGSGSTEHAVMRQNAEDRGNRRFILVQLPEPIDPPKTLVEGTTLDTIADITRERVRRAGKKIAADHPNVDTGFRSYKLATSNFTPWDGTPPDAKQGKLDLRLPDKAKKIARQLEAFTENVVPDRTQEDLLTDIILRLGYDLTVPVERLALSGHTVFASDNGAILACLEPSLTLDLFEEMAQRDPGQIVCLDSAFGDDDELKVNAVQVIRSRARSEEATIKLWLV